MTDIKSIVMSKNIGRNIKLPQISTIFPFKRNILHDSEEVQVMSELLQEFSSMSAEKYSKIRETSLFAAYFHPLVSDLPKYAILGKYMILFFVIDDHVECDWGEGARNEEQDQLIWLQIDQCFETLITGNESSKMGEWKPFIRALYSVFEVVFKEYNPIQRRRVAQAYKDWGEGNIEEGQLIRSGDKFKNIEDYLEVRKLSIGSRCVLAMIEYADGLKLEENEWQLMAAYIDHIGFVVVLANDYQSIEKEMIEHKNEPNKITNIVKLIMDWDKCSVDEALNKLVDIYCDYEQRTKTIKDELLAIDHISDDMKTYMDRAEYIMGGNLITGLLLRRYCEISDITENNLNVQLTVD